MIDEFFLELIFDFDRKSIAGYVMEVKAKRYREKNIKHAKRMFPIPTEFLICGIYRSSLKSFVPRPMQRVSTFQHLLAITLRHTTTW